MMSANSNKSSGTSFLIRVAVLLLFLLVAVGAYAYDRYVLMPSGKTTVDRVMDACMVQGADKSAVHAAAKCEPTSSETAGVYELEDYSFGRILPNLPGYRVTVVYLDDKVAETYRGGITDSERAGLK